MEKVDGHFTLVQLNRLAIPANIQRKFGIYQGWGGTYAEAKKKYESIPKERRRIPYVLASRVVVMFPSDASKSEVLRSLEFLLADLKERWKQTEST